MIGAFPAILKAGLGCFDARNGWGSWVYCVHYILGRIGTTKEDGGLPLVCKMSNESMQ